MLFNSYVFVFFFLPTVLVAWWCLRATRLRLVALLSLSYLFYGWWDVRFVPLMVIASSADFVAGLVISRADSASRRKLYLAALLVLNLGILAFFKYYDFAAATANRMLVQLAAVDYRLPLLGLVLPVGISFYTFNSISYTIDVYRGTIKPTRSFLAFSTFVAMFPHLVAGPIIRYADMREQFARLPTFQSNYMVLGVFFFVLGLGKKVLIADPIAAAIDPLFADINGLQALAAWYAVLGYSFQIYFDFSGYSDMAVGLAYLLGIRFPQNFNSPYQSADIAQFWRRWHMSLSFWLRDYLFIPMGGSRGRLGQTIRNILTTMALGGLWHGASWTFVIWGVYHGTLLSIQHWWRRHSAPAPRAGWAGIPITFLLVAVGWVFFRSASVSEAFTLLGAMIGASGLETVPAAAELLGQSASLVVIMAAVIAFRMPNTWQLEFPRARWAGAALAVLLFVCTLMFATPSPFLYFQF